MPFDYGEFDNRLTDANATRECFSCGSAEVTYGGTRVALVEVGDDDRVELYPSAGTVQAIFCAERICNVCGYVHLYAPVVTERSFVPPPIR